MWEFMEGLVRLSVLKKKGTKDARDAGMTLPDCVEEMMHEHVLKYGKEQLSSHSEARVALGSLPCRRVMQLHRTAMRKVFELHAKVDKSKETIELSEFMGLFQLGGLVDSSSSGDGSTLSRKEVENAFIFAQLDEEMAALWRATVNPCTTLIFPEFFEAVGRIALKKFQSDGISSVDRKLHEMCQLIIAGPAGLPHNEHGIGALRPTSRSGRRAPLMPQMKSMMTGLKEHARPA